MGHIKVSYLSDFHIANPARAAPEYKGSKDKEEKCSQAGKIWVPCSSSYTKAAKTCREWKKG